ncbi:MAG TPA: siphovirus Gp157 family protein [Roseateles sp.]
MTALYVIANEYRDAASKLAELDLDEQTIADTLESLSGDLEVKAQNVALMVRCFEADAANCKQWAKDANDRAKAIEARAERMRQYLADNLEACGIEKVEGPGVAISFRKSSAVVIDGEDLIPAEFMRTKPAPAPEPDKKAIADAIKAGQAVPGAHVEQRKSLQIR